MPCPADFVAVAALVALGSTIGAQCAVKPKANDNWVVVPNLWGGVVGEPSAKKSPALAAALKPMDRLIAKARETYKAAAGDYETGQIVFEAQKDAIESRIKEAARKPSKGDPTAIATELRKHGEQAPDLPTLRRFKTNDCTVEKLGELLRDNPSGVLVLRDELVGLLATWEREGREGERAFFLEGWNGVQGFDTDRIGRGNISIPNLCLSIFGGIQPDKLTGYLEQATHTLANDGMLQRFQLLVYPDACPWEWRDRAPNRAACDEACSVFETLADFDPIGFEAFPADAFAKFPFFCFDGEAQRVFIEWSEDLHRNRMPGEDQPIIQQHLAKFDKLFPALALIFHLVDGAALGTRGNIGKAAALRAAAWCEYLEAHARRCYGLLKDDGLRAAQALAAKLKRNALEDGFTVRDVRRNQWRSLTTDDGIQAALDWLENEGWLRSAEVGGTGPGGGRRTVRYWINPAMGSKPQGGTP
ncbi:MAG: YfjI family protein [Formivibrio sp.]|nr:YfjI family protein [Formivibrio sp.]